MSLLFPAGLALGALAVPLVALWFLRIRRRRVRVSSLLPWHALRRAEQLASPFQRLKRHLLLLLQLLALAALVIALARPATVSRAAPARAVVFLVDVSASMGATDAAPTRAEAAAREATEILDTLGPQDEAMLVLAGRETAVVAPFTRDHGVVRAALSRVRATEAEGSLRDGLALALSLAKARPSVEVVVLSDGGTEDLSGIAATDVRVRYAPIGRLGRNAAITALDLRRSPASDLERQLFATLAGFGPEPLQVSAELWLNDQVLAVRAVTLAPASPVSLVFDLPGDAAGVARLELHATDDLLPADNVAFAPIAPTAEREVLLVGGDRLTARALAADPRTHLVEKAASAVTPADLDRADAIFFEGAVPDGLDGRAYAILGPDLGGPVKFGPAAAAPRVLSADRGHPVLRAVRFGDVAIAEARGVVDAGGLTPIVDGDAGPLVLAGTRLGGRVVALAFDPLASDLPLRVAWPVFLLNTTGWLTEGHGGGEAALIRTGEAFVRRVDGAATASVAGPDGTVEVPIEDAQLQVTDTRRVGVYRVTAGAVSTSFAANLLSERESAIQPRLSLPLGAGATGTATLAEGRRELWRPLLAAALAILALEWLVWAADGRSPLRLLRREVG